MKNNELISQPDQIDRKIKEVTDRVKNELMIEGMVMDEGYPGPVLTALIRNILLVVLTKD